jgi:putative transposase
MSRRKRETDIPPLATIWQVPDELWEKVRVVLAELDPPKAQGRPRIDQRRALDAIVFRMRSGVQWNHLPKEFGDDSSIHRTFQRWVESGAFDGIWALLVVEMDALGGVAWDWQAADTSMGKARLGGDQIGPNPTDRGKNGVKRSLLTDAVGGPLAVVVSGANVHDQKLLAATLDAVIVERPGPTEDAPQHLCLDKGYDSSAVREAVIDRRYEPHIRRIGEEKLDENAERKHPARRWVVERTLAWLSKCRAILVRYDKKARNYLALLKLACALIWYRKSYYVN